MRYLLILIFSLTLLQFSQAQNNDSTKVLELIVKLNATKQDTIKVNILNKLVDEFIGVDIEKALKYSKQAQVLSQKTNYKKGLSKAYYNTAKCFYYQYEFDSIIYYYELRKNSVSNEIDIEVAANFEFLIGLVKHIQSNYSEAIKYYNESFRLHKNQNNIKDMVKCYNNLGAAYYDMGNYEKALENYFNSLEKNDEIENAAMTARTLSNIGGIYEEQEKYSSALEYYRRAILIATEIGSKKTIADIYRNIGGIYSERGKFDSTIIVYNRSLELYEELNNIRGMVVLYNLFGQTYARNWVDNPELLDYAHDYYKKSLDLNNQGIKEVEEKIVSYQGIAEVYINKNNFQNSIPYLKSALEMSREIESLVNIKKTHEYLSTAYAGLGYFKEAYNNHLLYKNWSDSLKNDENIEMLTQTSMQYEFDKQQKEQEFYQAQKDLEYQQKQKRDKLIRLFILAVLLIVSGFSVQVLRSYQRKKKDNILLAEQNEEIEKQKEEITDSIVYAKRIQTAILPTDDWVNENLPDHFVMFRPRDIVSGDYYWMNKIDNKVIIVAADCTGHGVPGAFMSMLGVSFLNEIVNKNNIVQPNLILNQLRNQVKRTLDQTGKDGEAKDGMDIAICVIDFDEMKLQYSGAYNPLYLYRKGELIETKADKMPIGIYIREKDSFTNHEIDLEKGDTFYIFSDGFADQFGGPKGGKFKSRPFKKLLADIQPKTMVEQWEILESTIDDWRGDIDQIDDIIILGVRV